MRVIMKHLSIYNVLIATALLSLALLAACSSEEQTYDGPSYVLKAITIPSSRTP